MFQGAILDIPWIVDISPKMERRFGKGKMLIPKPLDIDALIRKVKKRELVSQSQIREKLAKDFKTNVTCPITTGIFIRIAAEAAEEDLRARKKEGYTIEPGKGKKPPKVKDFEKYLVRL